MPATKFSKFAYWESPGLPIFRDILENWVHVQRDYIGAFDGDDHPWHYRERTHIGFLSGAAWRSEAVALEEWQTEKGTKIDRRKGRSDLYLYFHKQEREFWVEAKHMWSRVTGSHDKEISYIERSLAHATRDAKELKCSRHEQLGILFVAPYFPAGKQKNMRTEITQWLKRVHTSIPHCAMSWLLHESREWVPQKDDFSVGIVLLARQPK